MRNPAERFCFSKAKRFLNSALRLVIFLLGLLFSNSGPSLALASEESDERELETLQRDLKPQSTSSPKVLDFEADIIEGERKLPSLFLQMEIETPNLDAVIYRRKNFNEFHVLEVDRKPLYKKPD